MDNIGVLKMKNKKIIYLSIIALIILSFNVSSFGISSPYWDENSLYVSPGEVKEVIMVLQNMPPAGTENIIANVDLNSGYEIAEITDKERKYSVPLGSNNVPVHIKIMIPDDAKPKQEWQVGVSVRTVADNQGGVGIGSGVNKGFKVIVKEITVEGNNKKPSNFNGVLLMLGVLIIIVLLIKYIYKGKNKHNS